MGMRLFVTVLLALGAYAAAIGTYLILPEQTTDASFMEGAIKISGPIAAAIIVLLILVRVFNTIVVDPKPVVSALDPEAKTLDGVWDLVSRSYGESKEHRQSRAQFTVSEHELTLQGGGLDQVNDGATKSVGQWQCENVFFEKNQLVYIYEMEDRSFPDNPQTRGVVVAQLEPGVQPMKFTGTWNTFGGNSHGGVITLTKRG